ncbi:NifU family protein [Sphaerobacter thermophilus]|uniref:Nitrogen-fixing NifU domain protein n=1 Tax=Sphaerobacter thermophilus (strain ATCC 49802 / DSM 20745 / KCCM 41009 / NCIMB 13125 / S 6022) TaxID=479434 RepID=D1CAV8_SPHTD|nr:NifU family protein [Sphaerobacter thermophilus]ACZ39905.1 nitrogen-fixing NifU domain protein [Sphaerobacter thermophilus DSM 20745]
MVGRTGTRPDDRAARLDAMLARIESFPEPELRDQALGAIQELLAFYGDGLGRALAILVARDPTLPAALAEDELVAHILLLHGLHPVPVEERVGQALDRVRPYLHSHGGDVDLLEIVDGVARVRLRGTCRGCPASAVTLRLAIERAVHELAPDLDGIEAVTDDAPVPREPGILANGAAGAAAGDWTTVGRLELPRGEARLCRVEGVSLLVLDLDGTLYAYRDGCPRCGTSLAGNRLAGQVLVCPGCGSRYDARLAGRCLDAPEHYLEPVPLLVDAGIVRVALPTVTPEAAS